ncbi:uncharacterized protein PAC_04816 [Phialocephala subalpina]|uniref:Uncharacterized protein n=1 Tax=Phialocephala subalpina TaxID=576137 RepID=A0A1L7WQ98_9HELO|nr:uncharacterized protein PAC_04816 [Phialocephala subalpina]
MLQQQIHQCGITDTFPKYTVMADRTSNPQLKRTQNEAFRTLREAESLDLDLYTVKIQSRKLSFDQRYKHTPVKLCQLAQFANNYCNFEMQLGSNIWIWTAVLQYFRPTVLARSSRVPKSWDSEEDASREACDVALYTLLYEETLEKVKYGVYVCGI